MEYIWHLLLAVFMLVAAIALIAFAYVFENTVIAVIGIYGAIFLFLIGCGVGLFAIIDHNNANKGEEEKE